MLFYSSQHLQGPDSRPLDARPHGWITVYIFFHGTSKDMDAVAKPRHDRGALPESAKPSRRSPASGSGGLPWRDR